MKISLRRAGKLAGGLGPLLALCLVLALAVPALAQPTPPPCWFYGTVRICETLVEPGTVVTARIDGVENEWTTTVDELGRYGYGEGQGGTGVFYVESDDPETPEKDGGEPGDIVKFYVLDRLAGQAEFESLQSKEQNLQVTEVYLTVNSTAGGSVTDPGEGVFTYDCGQVVDLLAEPETNYAFVNWTGDVGTVANPDAADTTITMNGDYEITANFTPTAEAYDLTVTSDGCCTVTVGTYTVDPGATEVFTDIPYGTYVELEAVAPDCCSFDGWVVDGEPVGGNPITVIMISDHTAVATCTPVGLLTLTVDVAGDGDVEVNGVAPGAYPAAYDFDCCTEVGLEAIAADGWAFTGWSGNLSGSTNPTTIHMDENKTVTANFAPIGETYLTVNTTAGGTVTDPGVGTFSYDTGTVVNLVAEHECGYRFVNWTGDVGTVANPDAATTTITMNGNYEITANFVSGVIGEIPLSIDNDGWNTFSTPIYLDPCCDTWAELFAFSGIEDEDVGAIYGYDGSSWEPIMSGVIKPLEGYYLKRVNPEGELTISIAAYWDNPEPDILPRKLLVTGLNFIGTPTLEDRDVVSALSDVYLVPGVGYSRVIKPEENPNDWPPTNEYRRDEPPAPTMVAFKAYWVIMGWWEGDLYLYGPPLPTP